jgi:hypothetical protein
VGNVPVYRPVAASSVRARNDSKYRLGYAEGNIVIETVAPPSAKDGLVIPTRLQLDAAGQIEILARDAIVEARAWHGLAPKGWTSADYEDGFEGSIKFEGTLAQGAHSLRAAHRLEMKFSPDTSLQVDAEAKGGAITGDLLSKPIEPLGGRASWHGATGSGQGGTIRLRTDEGPISLIKIP